MSNQNKNLINPTFYIQSGKMEISTTVELDKKGRLLLPKKLREDLGKKFKVEKSITGIRLIPISKDPISDFRLATRKLQGKPLDKLKQEIKEELEKELTNHG